MNFYFDTLELETIKNKIDGTGNEVYILDGNFNSKFTALDNTKMYSNALNTVNTQISSISNSFKVLSNIISTNTNEIIDIENQLVSEINAIVIPNIEGATSSTLNSSATNFLDRNYATLFYGDHGNNDYNAINGINVPIEESINYDDLNKDQSKLSSISNSSENELATSEFDMENLENIILSKISEGTKEIEEISTDMENIENLDSSLRKIPKGNGEIVETPNDMENLKEEHIVFRSIPTDNDAITINDMKDISIQTSYNNTEKDASKNNQIETDDSSASSTNDVNYEYLDL